MIDLATAAIIAKTASDAVGAFDKIFRGFVDVTAKREPRAPDIPPPDFAYVDSPGENAIVAKSRHTGQNYQVVTYEELCKKLNRGDREFIETLTRSMENYQRQWNSAFEAKSLAGGMDVGRYEAQLEYLAKQIAECLIKVLDFVGKMGLYLDDHYHMARQVAEQYLSKP